MSESTTSMWTVTVWTDGPKPKAIWMKLANIQFPFPRAGDGIRIMYGHETEIVKSVNYDYPSWDIDIVIDTTDPGNIYDEVF